MISEIYIFQHFNKLSFTVGLVNKCNHVVTQITAHLLSNVTRISRCVFP